MKNTMDAAQLHAIYAPLWEKAPETRPTVRFGTETWKLGLFDGGMSHTPLLAKGAFWGWCREPYQSDRPWDNPKHGNVIAIALCREVALDWLRKNAYGTVELSSLDSVRIADRGHGGSVRTYDGPTFDHALVAAAMASLGKAPGTLSR